jgi:ubiquinone biosynthesis monooxygenase Coq7
METQNKPEFDISIIRPQMHNEDVWFRGQGMTPSRLKGIKKGLLALHTLEGMAVTIYKYQITRKESELNRDLIAAMCNEMTHLQDFQVKLFEYGWRPGKLRGVYLIVGFVLGFSSRLMGRERILKTGIWVETKAVNHYKELLETIEWDEDTRRIVQKDQADEHGHIARWQAHLKRS